MKDNIKNTDVWIRGLYTVLFALIFYLVFLLVLLIAVFQFLMKLVTGEYNEELLELSGSLSVYIGQVLRYATFKNDTRPYPFSAWPAPEPAIVPDKPLKKTARKKRTRKKTGSKANSTDAPDSAGPDEGDSKPS